MLERNGEADASSRHDASGSGFSALAPIDVRCAYRFQSFRRPELGSLRGALVAAPGVLSSKDVNEELRRHPSWRGRSLVNLQAVFVEERTGVFATNDDALYHESDFSDVVGTPISSDLVDLTKLRDLFSQRLANLATVFTSEALVWLNSTLGAVERAASNEYTCHEAGHRLTFAVDDKHAGGFFRVAGRLAWPLIYMEEYRADVNAWGIASQALASLDAARVVLYTLAHRLGLAAQNLQSGRPGVGYVPFLHFVAMVDAGALRPVSVGERTLLEFADDDPAVLIAAALEVVAIVDKQINACDHLEHPDRSAEAMLEFALPRLRRSDLAATFVDVMRQ